MRARPRQRGFTLLEILVALAILAVVVVAAVRNNNFMIDSSVYLRDKTLAHFVAMNKAADLRLANKWVDVGKSNGESVLAGRRWAWTVTGRTTPDPDVRAADIAVKVAGPEQSEQDEEDTALTLLTIYVGR